MDENSRYIHDAYSAFAERSQKRLWILCILFFVLLVVTNAGWIYYESQFVEVETTTIEATQDGSGTNLVSGGDALNVTESKDN